MPREPFVCTGHDGLDDAALRNHNLRPCKDDATRRAMNAYQRANRAAAKAAREGLNELTASKVPAEPEYVDHFKTPAEPTAPLEALVTTSLNNNLGPVIENMHAIRPAKPTPRPSMNRPSHGASRRLRGLTNLGYTPKEMATHCGLSVDSIWWLLIAPPATIKTETHAAIERSFKALRIQLKTAITDSPEVRNAARARGLAELHNWPGAFDWEDIDTVGDIPTSTRGRVGADVDKLAQAIADAALDDIVTVAPTPVVDTVAIDKLQEKHDELLSENARQLDTIVKLQRAARFNSDLVLQLREEKNVLTEERDKAQEDAGHLADANASLHEQLTEAKFSNPAATVSLDATLSDTSDAFSIEFEPTPAGGFTLTLPTSLLTR